MLTQLVSASFEYTQIFEWPLKILYEKVECGPTLLHRVFKIGKKSRKNAFPDALKIGLKRWYIYCASPPIVPDGRT